MRSPTLLTTLDLYLAAYLALSGISPQLQVKEGRVLFGFPANAQLYRLISDFNSNIAVPVAGYVTAVKALRGQMLTARSASLAAPSEREGAKGGRP